MKLLVFIYTLGFKRGFLLWRESLLPEIKAKTFEDCLTPVEREMLVRNLTTREKIEERLEEDAARNVIAKALNIWEKVIHRRLIIRGRTSDGKYINATSSDASTFFLLKKLEKKLGVECNIVERQEEWAKEHNISPQGRYVLCPVVTEDGRGIDVAFEVWIRSDFCF